MAITDKKMILKLTADNKRLRTDLAKSKQHVRGFKKSTNKAFSEIKTAFAGAFSVYAVSAFAQQLVMLRAEFTKTISRVKALTGATKLMTKSLSDQAQMMGRSTIFTANEAAQAMTFLAQAGMDVNEISEALPGTLQLAAAGAIELSEAADIATNILAAYRMEVKELSKVNDILANVQANTNTSVIEFAEAFKMVGPLAKSAGLEIEEISTLIGILANNGIKGTQAGTGLRAMIAKLINPTAEAQSKLDALGITTHDLDGNFRGLAAISKDLAKYHMNLTDVFATFDVRAALTATTLAGSIETYDELLGKTKEMGTSMEMMDTQTKNLWGNLKLLSSAWKGLLQDIGESGDSPFTFLVKETSALLTNLKHIVFWGGKVANMQLLPAAYDYRTGKEDTKKKPAAMGAASEGGAGISNAFQQDYGIGVSSGGMWGLGFKSIIPDYRLFREEIEKLTPVYATFAAGLESVPEVVEENTRVFNDFNSEIKELALIATGKVGASLQGIFTGLASGLTEGRNALKHFLEYFKQWAVKMIAKLIAVTVAAVAMRIALGGTVQFGELFGSMFKNAYPGMDAFNNAKNIGSASSSSIGVSGGAKMRDNSITQLNVQGVLKGEDIHLANAEYTRRQGNTL